MRRRYFVVLTVIVLWAADYVAVTVSNCVRPAGPAEPRLPEDAGEN